MKKAMTNYLEANLTTPKITCDIIFKVQKHEEAVFEVIRQALQFHKPDEIMLSFNGGKDCTVLLHILNKFYQTNTCLKHLSIPVLYIQHDDAFEEIELFVNKCPQWYNINLIKQKGPIKEVLKEVCDAMPHIKAIFMGTRRTDPYCENMKTIQATDPGWPSIIRIMPLLDWKYHDVWHYIFVNNVPYSSLYNCGYTSIGNKKNTQPNPKLRIMDPITRAINGYRPAYELVDEDGTLERAGRL